MDPEFGMMLQYLQELSSKKKPNYKMLRTQFEIMKDWHNLKWNLEWVSKNNGESSMKVAGHTDNFEKNSVHSKMSDFVPKENSIRAF